MLDRQTIVMPFGQGVDTKTDPKQVVAGKLLELENGVFTTLKALRKRDGNVQLDNTVEGGGAITNGSGLATYGDELLLANGSELFSYVEGNDSWRSKGAFVSTQVGLNSVVRDGYTQSRPDAAVADNGLRAFAWQDSSGSTTIRYSIIDPATNQTIVSSALLTSTGIKPRVLCNGGTFLFYYYDISSQTLKLAQLSSGSPTLTPLAVSITNSAGGINTLDFNSPNYDCAVVGLSGGPEYIVLCFGNSTPGALGDTTVRVYSSLSPTVQFASQVQTGARSRAIAVFQVASGFVGDPAFIVAYATDNDSAPYTTNIAYNGFRVVQSPSPSIAGIVNDVITAGPFLSDDVRVITGCSTDLNVEGFELYWGGGSGPKTSRSVVDFNYVQSSTLNWRLGVIPFSRVFAYNGVSYLPVVHNSTLQSTYFVITGPGNIVAKALPGTAGPAPATYPGYTLTAPVLGAVASIDADTFLVPCTETANLGGAGFVSGTGVSSLTIDIDEPVHSFAHETLGNNLHFTGGFVQMYDGVNVVEHGFHLYPEDVTATGLTFGGSMDAGTYSYAVCYEWVDQQNNIHRSAPSTPVQVTIQVPTPPAPANQGSALIIIPYLQLTDKTGDRGVQVVVYRTVANGTILYRLSSLTAPNQNVIGGAFTFTYTDTANDSVLVSGTTAARPEMYTQPIASLATGELTVVPNYPAPPAKLIQLHRNRLWVVDSTKQLQLWYSKEVTIDAPVEFNDGFVKQIDPRGGPITALATVDDKLLVFKKDHIFFIVGQGPTATDQNNDLSDAILITTDVGCIDPRSVVGTPVGIMFQTAKGIYLIGRSLAVDYIGAPVEAYNSETVTSATLLNDKNQVRFTLGNGKTLVFDYFVSQWGVFTGQYAFDTVIWQGASTMLRTNGRVLKETPGVWTDAGSSYALKATTSWLSFTNVQGFQRVRRAQILGQWYSAHNLQVDVCVDFDDTVVQSVVVQPTTPSVFGGVSPYGSGTYGGTFQLYQWRIDLARQKTQAVKFTIQDLPTATAGEGMSLSSIAFEVGAKKGLNKVPAGQIFS
jgi:hypothetical protein